MKDGVYFCRRAECLEKRGMTILRSRIPEKIKMLFCSRFQIENKTKLWDQHNKPVDFLVFQWWVSTSMPSISINVSRFFSEPLMPLICKCPRHILIILLAAGPSCFWKEVRFITVVWWLVAHGYFVTMYKAFLPERHIFLTLLLRHIFTEYK